MYNVVGFDVLMAVTVKKSVFWEVTPFIVVESYGHFGETRTEVGGPSERFVQTAGSHIARDSILHFHTLYYKTVNSYEQHRVIKVLSHILYHISLKIMPSFIRDMKSLRCGTLSRYKTVIH